MRHLCGSLSGLLRKGFSCFDQLSTNGEPPTSALPNPFALSLSKGERGIFPHPGARQRGAALVTVLLAVTLLTVVVVEFAYSTQIDQHLAYNAFRALQTTYLARSGVNLAILALKRDAQNSGIDAFNEDWAHALPPLPVGEGAVTIRVTDEQGKLNLNVLRNSNGTI